MTNKQSPLITIDITSNKNNVGKTTVAAIIQEALVSKGLDNIDVCCQDNDIKYRTNPDLQRDCVLAMKQRNTVIRLVDGNSKLPSMVVDYQKVIINPATNRARLCGTIGCNDFVFKETPNGLVCRRCGCVATVGAIETIAPFPRSDMFFYDRLNELPRYSFWSIEGGVKRVHDSVGKWVEKDAVAELIDQAQDEINRLKALLLSGNDGTITKD